MKQTVQYDFFIAAALGYTGSMRLLLSKTVKLNHQDIKGETALLLGKLDFEIEDQ